MLILEVIIYFATGMILAVRRAVRDVRRKEALREPIRPLQTCIEAIIAMLIGPAIAVRCMLEPFKSPP